MHSSSTLHRPLWLVMTVLASGLIAACGGGGTTDTPPTADVVDKYVGTWLQACEDNAELSFTIVKVNATKVDFTLVAKAYNPALGACSGSPVTESVVQGNFTIVGSKQIATETVDKIDFVITSPEEEAGSGHDIILLNKAQDAFRLGDSDVVIVDPEGYPTQLDPTPFVKQ